jgi:hypothetical protein
MEKCFPKNNLMELKEMMAVIRECLGYYIKC